MKRIRLNGAKMADREAAHAYLKRKLDLPDYYGNNLDALWDCLSTDFSPKKIILVNKEAMVEGLGSYGEAIITLLLEVSEENESIEVEIEDED